VGEEPVPVVVVVPPVFRTLTIPLYAALSKETAVRRRKGKSGMDVLGLPVGIEEERVRGGAPRIGVAHAPDGDRDTLRDGEAGFDNGLVVRRGSAGNVEFCGNGEFFRSIPKEGG
jgi:hypothetical protein